MKLIIDHKSFVAVNWLALQTGQFLCSYLNHCSAQEQWRMCLQLSTMTSLPSRTRSRQTVHMIYSSSYWAVCLPGLKGSAGTTATSSFKSDLRLSKSLSGSCFEPASYCSREKTFVRFENHIMSCSVMAATWALVRWARRAVLLRANSAYSLSP